jgi:hypothetical protein
MKSLLSIVLGEWLSYMISGLLIAALLWWAWRRRACSATSQEFAFTLGAFLLAETIALPLLPPFNQVLLLMPAVMIFRDWSKHPVFLRGAFTFCLTWPWVVSVGLLMIAAHPHAVDQAVLLPSAMVVFVPFLLFFLLANGWRRGAV